MSAQPQDVIPAGTNQITEYKPFEAKLAEFSKKYINVVYDLDDEEQEKQAKSDSKEIGTVIKSLDQIHDDIKAPLKTKVDLIDGERKRIKDQLLEIQDSIKSQLKAKAEKEAARLAAIENRINAIRDFAKFDFQMISADVSMRIQELDAVAIDDSFEHLKANAALAKMETTQQLQDLYSRLKVNEEQQAELNKLRQAEAARQQQEHEEQIRREAEERVRTQVEAAAKRELEAAQRAQLAAEEVAIRAKQESEQAAQRAAQQERERIEREQRVAAEQAEKLRLEEEARKAQAQHRNRIHKAAKQSLINAGIDETTATNIITLIKDGKVKHVAIQY